MPRFIQLIIALLVIWLIRLLLGFLVNWIKRKQIVVVRRLRPVKVLRAHLLGLSGALLFSLLAVLTISLSSASLYAGLLALILFAGSIWGWPWLLIIGLGALWITANSAAIPVLGLVCEWYVLGYIFGAVLATLYNDIAYWHTLTFRSKAVKVAWAFDTRRSVNIIKSPRENEVTVEIVERAEPAGGILIDPDRRKIEVNPGQELYDYKIDPVPPRPYTIAFVANPVIRKKKDNPTDPREDDPIIKDRDLFLRSVDRALFNLESDEVVGRPEIWSRVRVVVIFDEKANSDNFAMVRPFAEETAFGGIVAENMLDPLEQMTGNYKELLGRAKNSGEISDDEFNALQRDIDVIFALSGSGEYDRSAAHYSDWIESKHEPERGEVLKNPHKENSTNGYKGYEYRADPNGNKKTGSESEINVAACSEEPFNCVHDEHAANPGRVALSILGASGKTFIHEFAHAMSSAFHGAIVDEYFDTSEKINSDGSSGSDDGTAYYVNRIERRKPANGKIIPVHKVFATYNKVMFYSDLAHPSAEENWLGYFPERHSATAACTMDRSYGPYRFDKLLSNFIYDRMIAKINRS